MASNATSQNESAKKMVESVRVRVSQSPSSSSSSPSNPAKHCGHLSDCCSVRFMLQNHSNFKRSGPPAQFMFYSDGSWINFPNEVFQSLRLGFLDRKPMIDVSDGGSKYLFDFLRMLQTDFMTGNQRSIAWIDENKKCFFPKMFVGEEFANGLENSENPKVEIEIRVDGKRKREELRPAPNGDEPEVSSWNKRDEEASKRQRLVARWPNSKLLSEGEKADWVRNFFLARVRTIDSGATITAIHQCTRTGPLEKARHEVFQKQNEITKAARGSSNITYAWYGASGKDLESILTHGFAVPSNVSKSGAYGVGIYLSPVGSPHTIAMQLEPDDNGEKHVILCRVILGNVEKVEAGSQQCHPSSVEFDTGADDLKNPKWYVVWSTNMNRHILPECVVSYKCPNHLSGLLLSKMKSSLPAPKVREVMTLYEAFRAGKVAKDVFVKHLRSVAGDELLQSTIQEIRDPEE